MLPQPMLSRPGPLPKGSPWAIEVKWDGFRAIVSTEDELRVRGRRGWNMTVALPELAKIPSGPVLDGEVVAFNADGDPHFPLLARRVLNYDRRVRAHLMVFDVLGLDGEDWPGARRWIKFTNPAYWRRESEVEGVRRSVERRTRVLA